jgi:23S rRNA (uridine2552-2'-O)-methyltransferase
MANPWFDSWAKLAKEKGYPARSVFKLKEINERFKVLKRGDKVLDLGTSPGSWAKYACEVVGEAGLVVGIDLSPPKFSGRLYRFIQKNVFEVRKEDLISQDIPYFDVILSDLAPKTTGIRERDHLESVRLAERALQVCEMVLRKGGNAVVKVFEGPEFPRLRKEFEKRFKDVKLFRPKAVRKESREVYVVALNFKG